jgi:hypothetical protein
VPLDISPEDQFFHRTHQGSDDGHSGDPVRQQGQVRTVACKDSHKQPQDKCGQAIKKDLSLEPVYTEGFQDGYIPYGQGDHQRSPCESSYSQEKQGLFMMNKGSEYQDSSHGQAGIPDMAGVLSDTSRETLPVFRHRLRFYVLKGSGKEG